MSVFLISIGLYFSIWLLVMQSTTWRSVRIFSRNWGLVLQVIVFLETLEASIAAMSLSSFLTSAYLRVVSTAPASLLFVSTGFNFNYPAFTPEAAAYLLAETALTTIESALSSVSPPSPYRIRVDARMTGWISYVFGPNPRLLYLWFSRLSGAAGWDFIFLTRVRLFVYCRDVRDLQNPLQTAAASRPTKTHISVYVL